VNITTKIKIIRSRKRKKTISIRGVNEVIQLYLPISLSRDGRLRENIPPTGVKTGYFIPVDGMVGWKKDSFHSSIVVLDR